MGDSGETLWSAAAVGSSHVPALVAGYRQLSNAETVTRRLRKDRGLRQPADDGPEIGDGISDSVDSEPSEDAHLEGVLYDPVDYDEYPEE